MHIDPQRFGRRGSVTYRVITDTNVKEIAEEFKERLPNIPDFNNLEEDHKQATLRNQYIMIIQDGNGTFWRFNADVMFGQALVFEEIKKELNL